MDISGAMEFGWLALFWTTVMAVKYRQWSKGQGGAFGLIQLVGIGLLVFVADSCFIFALFKSMPEDLTIAQAEATLDSMTAFALSTWIAWKWIVARHSSTTQPVDE